MTTKKEPSSRDRALSLLNDLAERMDDDAVSTLEAVEELHDAGLLAPDLPEPIINPDDGNPEWHADEYTVDVDRGMVSLWTPDGAHWEQTPNQAHNLVIALLAAADAAEKENSHADA